MKVSVKYFGVTAEKLGLEYEEFEIVVETSCLAREILEKRHPGLKQSTYAVSIDRKMRDVLKESDEIVEIAVLPPFAGG